MPIHPPFKKAIYGSGFRPSDYRLTKLFGVEGERLLGLETNTLHVIGKLDPIVPNKLMRDLVDCCNESTTRVEEHDGGKHVSLMKSSLLLV